MSLLYNMHTGYFLAFKIERALEPNIRIHIPRKLTLKSNLFQQTFQTISYTIPLFNYTTFDNTSLRIVCKFDLQNPLYKNN